MSGLIVVTGAAGALGQAVAHAFIEQGHAVLLVDFNDAVLHSAYEGVGGNVQFVVADLTDGAATQAKLGAALAASGPAFALCNIAGGFAMGAPVHDADASVWERMLDMNVATTLNACRAVVPGMLSAGAGKIINVSAASANTGKGSMGAYCAAKSAVARITESMAQELREGGINVNAVAPSIIDTPANRAAMPDADPSKWVSTRQLADIISFLASAQASALHGAVIPVVGLS
ncbi:SDR family NAD(P)-dependent oxidoreductase [Pseudomonas capeferrum]|uniref:SDR family NAD(P)-dependent oxidoreductase n=1 Tax=Pseudomonas capeferrum TaxID=1495066 RepID=UPI0015E3E3C6|nr:SDR family NAD(P)-dependent oxidoreductase [Pseudomonas capeferrum]MBA1204235.1 SDR family NAD(P)-dependent oxidoreductase [Pseudomonas capeferrum]